MTAQRIDVGFTVGRNSGSDVSERLATLAARACAASARAADVARASETCCVLQAA